MTAETFLVKGNIMLAGEVDVLSFKIPDNLTLMIPKVFNTCIIYEVFV